MQTTRLLRSTTSVLPKTFNTPSATHLRLTARTMASQAPSGLHIENTNIKTAEGITLDEQQKTLVGSVLDLFAGRPSLKKLALWRDDATFEDPITVAKGRDQYAPQWVCRCTRMSRFEFR